MKNIISVVIPVLALAVTALSALLYKIFLKTDVKVFGGPPGKDELRWMKDTVHKELYMAARDGCFLHGVSFENGSRNWVILVHGYDSNSKGMLYYAREFYSKGFNALVIDQRGYGLSSGNETSMGHLEKYDIADWADKLAAEKNADNIILLGVSMGAATVMLASAERLPAQVRAVIEDCGYTSVKSEFEYNFRNTLKLPPYPFLWICDIIARIRNGWSIMKDGNCVEAVRAANVPILFIHGSKDTFVPFAMQKKLYDACGRDDKEMLVIEGAEHTMSCVIDPVLYWDTVFGFIDKHLK